MDRTAFGIAALAAAALSACGGAVTGKPQQPRPPGEDRSGGHSPDHTPARDPEIAVREEFALAERRGDAEAYRLFAARHPEHALAAEARRRAEALER